MSFRYDTLLDEPFKHPTLLSSQRVAEKKIKLDFYSFMFSCLLPATAGFISQVYDGSRELDARNVV